MCCRSLAMTMTMLLMVAISVLSTAVAMTPEPLLLDCPPGTYLWTSPEGQDVCFPCQTGTYMDEYARKTSCKEHRVCKKSEKIISPGSSTTDVVCTCMSGERQFYSVDERYGYNCRPCKEGTIRQKVTGPFGEGDTGCCAPGTKAIRDELGQLWCQQLGRVTPLDAVTTTTKTSAPEGFTAQILPWWLYFIIAACTTFVIALIIIGILTFVEKRRQQRQVTLMEEGQSLTLNKSPP